MALLARLLLKMLPKAPGMLTYSDQLLMYDNLDVPIDEAYTSDIKEFLGLLPMKLSFTAVILCVEGEVALRCNMKDVTLTKNSLAIIPPGTKAEYLDLRKDCKVIVLVTPSQKFAPPASFHNNIYTPDNFTSPIFVEMEEGEVRRSVSIYRLLRMQLKEDEKDVNADLVSAYILLLAGVVAVALQRWKLRNRKTASNKEQIYSEFLNNLSEHYREHRDVAFYASLAGLSPKYFATVIFDASGNHPLDLIREQVIMDAHNLLKKGMPISEVCAILNFSSQSQFTNYFKTAMGVPPGEFVKNNKAPFDR